MSQTSTEQNDSQFNNVSTGLALKNFSNSGKENNEFYEGNMLLCSLMPKLCWERFEQDRPLTGIAKLYV